MADFTEVADRVWVARYEWFDVNVSVVEGDEGLLVLDTNASPDLARGVLADLRRLTGRPIRWVVNSHLHFDHTFGNGVFAAEGAELICHESAAEELPAHAADVHERAAADDDPRSAALVEVEPVVPERTFSSAISLDLGNRLVELVHPGRGHTSGDLVVRVPDADLVLAGDLVEESAEREAVPGFGNDCFPMEWPLTLDVVLGLTTSSSVVVPGHGPPVDREFVEVQRNDIGIVAETIRDLATRGVPVGQALDAGTWPYPKDHLAAAVRRGYAHLPRSQQRLPLV